MIFRAAETEIVRLVVATLLGGLVGWERESEHKPAGLRTRTLVCIGTTASALVSLGLPGAGEPGTQCAGVLV